MKWVSYKIGRDWWLFIETPEGKAIPIMRKGRIGDCLRW